MIGAIICGIAVIPAMLRVLYVGYFIWVPRYSAVAELFDDYGFNLRLDLYLTEDETRDSGRYLNVIVARAIHNLMIPGRNWSHTARTSIYRIDADHIAALSAFGNDYRIALDPFAFAPIVSDPGDRWQYLGAFDFAFPPGMRPRLQFFDRNLAECIPMGTASPRSWADKPRAQARQPTCPNQ